MWNERYNTLEYIYGKEPNDFLVSVINEVPKGKVLCIGEGEGRNAVYLAKLGYDVLALDSSGNALNKAKMLAVEHNVKIDTIVADLNSYKIEPNTYDLIISIFCHLPVELRKEVNKNIVESLKTDGILIMELFSKDQINNNSGGPKKLDMLLTTHDIEEELKGLNFKINKQLVRDISEGQLHNGKSSVIQVLATK